MTAKHVSLSLDQYGHEGSLIIDGTDVSKSVSREFALTRSSDDLPRLTLGVTPREFTYDGPAVVGVSESVAELLQSIGWTPPVGGATEGEVSA